MSNRLSAIEGSSASVSRTAEIVRAQWGRRGLEVYGLKKGDRVSIEPFGNGKVLAVNGETVKWLDPLRTETQIAICQDSLMPGDITIQGEEEVPTTVEYWDSKGQHLNGTENVMHEERTEKTFIQKMIEFPIRPKLKVIGNPKMIEFEVDMGIFRKN